MKSSNTINMTRLVCIFLIILITSCSQYKDPFQPIRIDFLDDHIYLMHLNNIDNLHTIVLKGRYNDLLPGSVVDSVYYDNEKKLYYEDIHSLICCKNIYRFNEHRLLEYFKEHTDITIEKIYTWIRNENVVFRIINNKFKNKTDTIFYNLEDGLLKTKLDKSSRTDYFYNTNNRLSKKIETEFNPQLSENKATITKEYSYWSETGKIKSIELFESFEGKLLQTFDENGLPNYTYYLKGSDTVFVLEIKKQYRQ